MPSFNKKIALRIGLVSIILAITMGYLAWLQAFNAAEELNKGLTKHTPAHLMEKSRGEHFDPVVIDAFIPISKSIYENILYHDEAAIDAHLDQVINHYLKSQLS